jgi:hypothetical protein
MKVKPLFYLLISLVYISSVQANESVNQNRLMLLYGPQFANPNALNALELQFQQKKQNFQAHYLWGAAPNYIWNDHFRNTV